MPGACQAVTRFEVGCANVGDVAVLFHADKALAEAPVYT